MTTSNEMNVILDRLVHDKPADGDVETLRQWLQSSEGQAFAQKVAQPPAQPLTQSKYNINIGQITGEMCRWAITLTTAPMLKRSKTWSVLW